MDGTGGTIIIAALPATHDSEVELVNEPPLPIRAVIEAKRAVLALVGAGVDFSPQPLGRHIDPNGIAGYYCDLSGKTRLTEAKMRDTEYDWVIPIAQYALGLWERRLDGDPTDAAFISAVEWLIERSATEEIGLVWRTGLPAPKYDLAPGWISAMGQGQAISTLLRAHQLSGEDRYLDLARQAFGPLRLPVSAGGAQREIDGALVLEEYPTTRPCAVLNGWIFALWGVHELAVAVDDRDARALFERSAAGVVELLPRYDVGWWSRYSLYDHGGRPDLAKPFYQELHQTMLEGLELITHEPLLGEYARRWRAQQTRLATARAGADKIAFRISRAVRSA
jgi:heparosan-N-sulfate-glucuronate 5-epimerase